MKTRSGALIWGKPLTNDEQQELCARPRKSNPPLTEDQQEYLRNKKLGLYRNTRYQQAEEFRKTGEFGAAMDTFLRVAWLDQNGPCNVGTINGVPNCDPAFERRTPTGNAPWLMLEIARGAITFGLDAEGVRKRFAGCALDEMAAIASLAPIVSMDEAWSGIVGDVSAIIANGGIPIRASGESAPTSVYDHRDKSAYGDGKVDPRYCENPFILKWWTAAHDQLLARRIKEDQWIWDAGVHEHIVAMSPPEAISAWKAEDPICSTYTGGANVPGGRFGFRYAWYGVLTQFARSRAETLGLTNAIRKPEQRRCPLCGQVFVEDSLPEPLVRRLGINHIDFCSPCLTATIFNNGSETASKEEIKSHLRKMADLLQRIPPQDFGGGMQDIRDMSTDERLAVLRELRQKPSAGRVKELFGSWFKALIDAELLENDARRVSLGTQCLARDGHTCLSLGEKTIDDLLHALGIPHEREPAYPVGNFRADFLVNGVFIEYFGLAGDATYDAKSEEKRKLCQAHGIKLIAILPKDLVSSKKLESMLLAGLELTGDNG